MLSYAYLNVLCLVTTISATITRSDLLLKKTSYANPFPANFSISDDLTVRFAVSTASLSTSLAALGDGIESSLATREFGGVSTFHNTGPISEIWLGEWEVETSVELDEGVTAAIDAQAYLSLLRSPPSTRILSLSGPIPRTTVPVSFNTTSTEPYGYCSGLDPGRRTFTISNLRFNLVFSLTRATNAAASAKGRIGEQSEQAIVLRSKLIVKEGCSRENPSCSKDRNGFELCSNWSLNS